MIAYRVSLFSIYIYDDLIKVFLTKEKAQTDPANMLHSFMSRDRGSKGKKQNCNRDLEKAKELIHKST